jgi:hypothetical protein
MAGVPGPVAKENLMQCGQCGSKINPGYYTCPNCRATYQKSASGLAYMLLFIPALGFVVLGLVFIAAGFISDSKGAFAAVPFGVLLIGVAFVLVWLINKKAPYKWVAERRIYPPPPR